MHSVTKSFSSVTPPWNARWRSALLSEICSALHNGRMRVSALKILSKLCVVKKKTKLGRRDFEGALIGGLRERRSLSKSKISLRRF